MLRPLSPLGADQLQLGGDLGTDNVDFMLEGIPTLTADQEPSNYMQNYHAASDTYDKVDLRQLTQNVAIVAAMTVGIADRAGPLGPRLNRTDIQNILQSSGLEQK